MALCLFAANFSHCAVSWQRTRELGQARPGEKNFTGRPSNFFCIIMQHRILGTPPLLLKRQQKNVLPATTGVRGNYFSPQQQSSSSSVFFFEQERESENSSWIPQQQLNSETGGWIKNSTAYRRSEHNNGQVRIKCYYSDNCFSVSKPLLVFSFLFLNFQNGRELVCFLFLLVVVTASFEREGGRQESL